MQGEGDGGEKEKVAKLNKVFQVLLQSQQSLSSNDVKNGEAPQPKNALSENQSKGESVPKGKRSSKKVHSESKGDEKNLVLRDAVLNGAGITSESGGKLLEVICGVSTYEGQHGG